jgi:enoyl-CoA hydratase/carnithine racemase
MIIQSRMGVLCRFTLGATNECQFHRIWAFRGATFSSSSKRVETTIDKNGIARVSLARPEKLNALDLPMFEAIAAEASRLKTMKSLRAVILTGQGRAFCTGLDVKTIVKNNPKKTIDRLLERPSGYSETVRNGNLAQDVGYLWRDLPVPVIACLHGMCFGGGMQIALGADFRFATPDCKLSIMEAKWGLIPDMSASVTLRELVRIDVAKELTMTGRVVNGEEAASLGLVTRCVTDPLAEAEKLANEIVERSPDSVALTKQMYQQTWVAPEEYCLTVETDLQKKLLASWNQIAASGRAFGVNIPYFQRKDP